MSWIQTYTGRKFYVLEPTAGMVCLEDIAHALSLTNRFGGHTATPYSVAQHCSLACVAGMYSHGDRLAMLCLLHDAAEAYLGDIVRPVKGCLPFFADMERRVMNKVYEALEVAPPNETEEEEVKEIDNRLVVTEARDLLLGGPRDGWTEEVGAEPYHSRIRPCSARRAERVWLENFRRIKGA